MTTLGIIQSSVKNKHDRGAGLWAVLGMDAAIVVLFLFSVKVTNRLDPCNLLTACKSVVNSMLLGVERRRHTAHAEQVINLSIIKAT